MANPEILSEPTISATREVLEAVDTFIESYQKLHPSLRLGHAEFMELEWKNEEDSLHLIAHVNEVRSRWLHLYVTYPATHETPPLKRCLELDEFSADNGQEARIWEYADGTALPHSATIYDLTEFSLLFSIANADMTTTVRKRALQEQLARVGWPLTKDPTSELEVSEAAYFIAQS